MLASSLFFVIKRMSLKQMLLMCYIYDWLHIIIVKYFQTQKMFNLPTSVSPSFLKRDNLSFLFNKQTKNEVLALRSQLSDF